MTVIVMAGTIGAGKSSLAKYLSEDLGTKAFYEPVDNNPVLPLFYKEPKRYAFLLQIYFLNQRFDLIKQAFSDDNNVLDRSIYEDSLLFHLNADLGRCTFQEVEVYDSLLKNMMQELPYAAHKKAPDLLVWIHVSFDKMLERIEKRGRDYEQIEYDETLYEYYKELNQRYNQWFADYDASPRIEIDGNKYDFVENVQDRKIVLNKIKRAINNLREEPFK